MVPTHAGVCLLMADIEPLKPSNTGWLVADVVPHTFAFGWSRTTPDPVLLALLASPQWQPLVVFPGEYVAPERVVHQVPPAPAGAQRRPLFILVDGTWTEARKMLRRSPYLDTLPVLSLAPDEVSQYLLRRSRRTDHFCTSEVAALCLALAGDTRAASALEVYLDVFTHHYLQARNQRPVVWDSPAHRALQPYCRVTTVCPPPAACPPAED